MDVQLLLPYNDFTQSVKILDDDRLRRQRSDVMTLLRAMTDSEHRNHHHPCCRMWRTHGYWVVQYGLAASAEWMARGNTDNTLGELMAWMQDFPASAKPEWFGDHDLHRSHQSYLVRTNPDRYREHFPIVPADLEMIWPGIENARAAAAKNATRARKLANELAARVEAQRAAEAASAEPDNEETEP